MCEFYALNVVYDYPQGDYNANVKVNFKASCKLVALIDSFNVMSLHLHYDYLFFFTLMNSFSKIESQLLVVSSQLQASPRYIVFD